MLSFTGTHHFAPKENLGDKLFFCGVVVVLVLIAGLMSGLTIGLLSISKTDLEVLIRSGTALERARAAKIEPVLRRPHLLLVTLVLCNAAATEALPIFLDRLLDPFTAVILSIIVVLVFGEIIPQSVCTRYALAVGSYSAWLVKLLMILCGIISYPISKLLDWILGSEHEGIFRRSQLKALVSIHSREENFGGNLTRDEIAIIRGALDLSSKPASAVMTPLDKVFMLSAGDVLDDRTRLHILESGHSRVPVHRASGGRQDILGVMLVKELIVIDNNRGIKAGEIRLRGVPFLQANTNLYDIMHLFESGRCHMAVLVAPYSESGSINSEEQLEEVIQVRIENEHIESEPLLQPQASMELGASEHEVVGIITLEDILEAIIQAEIVDETDRFVDNEGLERVDAREQLQKLPAHLRKLLVSREFMPRVGEPRHAGAPKAAQDRLDNKISAVKAQMAKQQADGLHRVSGRQRNRVIRADDGSRPGTPFSLQNDVTVAPHTVFRDDKPTSSQRTASKPEASTNGVHTALSEPLLANESSSQ